MFEIVAKGDGWTVTNGVQLWQFATLTQARAALRTVVKHGNHDQSTHGRRGGTSGTVKDITESLKTYFGQTAEEFAMSEGKKEMDARLIKAHVNGASVGDRAVEIVAEKQGFDGKPRIVSPSEMDELEKQGWTIAYRGIENGESVSGDTISAEQFAEQFKRGDYYAGFGTRGNGTYFSSDKKVAESYANLGNFGTEKHGVVLKVAIPPAALMQPNDFEKAIIQHKTKIKKNKRGDFYGEDEIGVSLVAKGVRGAAFNAINIDRTAFVIWDRSMLAVEETP